MDMKAQTYSLLALLMAAPLMVYIALYATQLQSIRYDVTDVVVSDQMHQLMDSIEKDFERALVISTKRAVLASTNHVIINGTYIQNSRGVLEELVLNATLNGNLNLIMAGNTLYNWSAKIAGIQTGFQKSIGFSGYEAETYDGFNIRTRVNLSIYVSDLYGIGEINRSFQNEILVSVEGFEDPIFLPNTAGGVSRIIKKHPHPYFAMKLGNGTTKVGNCSGTVTFNMSDTGTSKVLVTANGSGITGFGGVVAEDSGGAGLPAVPCYIIGVSGAVSMINSTVSQSNYSTIYLDQMTGVWSLPITSAIDNGYYATFNGTTGPDIFGRLSGNLSQGQNGLDTFVNKPQLSFFIPDKPEQSCLAHLYFSNQTYTGCKVRGLHSWFRLDSSNAARYNLTELLSC